MVLFHAIERHPSDSLPSFAERSSRFFQDRMEAAALVLTLGTHALLDDTVSEGLEQRLLLNIGNSGARQVILDFHQVQSVSALAIRMLDRVGQILREHQVDLIVCGLNPLVTEEFHLARLGDIEHRTIAAFKVTVDVSSALALAHGGRTLLA